MMEIIILMRNLCDHSVTLQDAIDRVMHIFKDERLR